MSERKKKRKRMTEEEAITVLKKVREYYSINRERYNAVIEWLEGRVKRKVKS